MPAEEAAKAAVQLPENDNLRAVEVTYRYRIDDVDASAPHRPLGRRPARCGPTGRRSARSSAFTPLGGRAALATAQIDELERLAFRAGPALENARRFREARALADLDALTGLHNRRYFHETLAREVARAQRYRRRLALIVFDLDDFKAINDRVGHLAGDAVLAEAAERMLLGRPRRRHRLPRRRRRVRGRPAGVERRGRASCSPAGSRARSARGRSAQAGHGLPLGGRRGAARGRPTRTTLFERADEALYRAKELGKAPHASPPTDGQP